MLTPDEIKKIKESLEKKKKELEKQLGVFASKDQKVKGNYLTRFPDFGKTEQDNAEEVSEYDRSLPLEHGLEIELEKVNKALEKIEKGENYGICVKCGEKIEKARLGLRPWSARCIKCAKEN